MSVVIPLLSPITFFLLVVNIVYAFFDTFGVIHTITSGGPEQSTTILVYKVFSDGFVSQDLGSSAAQSVILLILVGVESNTIAAIDIIIIKIKPMIV